jgi:hypothetical protein
VKNLEDIFSSVDKQMTADKNLVDKKQPPVDLWAKQFQGYCGDINIYIDAQGNWFHEGVVINRQALIKLFASILWHDNSDGLNQYFLITPAEKLKIKVADTPFVAVLSERQGMQLQVKTNLDEAIVIGAQHPVELRMYKGQRIPYVCIRYDLWARVGRTVYEQWLNTAIERQGVNDTNESKTLTLTSGDYLFVVARE